VSVGGNGVGVGVSVGGTAVGVGVAVGGTAVGVGVAVAGRPQAISSQFGTVSVISITVPVGLADELTV
jgi:F0F1-type ATP synthase membrane subunit c/vacuolar-type H+-ATPase subunit K